MPTCDVLLRHFRKMLLYTQGYAVAYSHLLSTLDVTDGNIVPCCVQHTHTHTHTHLEALGKCGPEDVRGKGTGATVSKVLEQGL